MTNDVGVVILAAGASTRLGRPKQLVRINGETLLERSVRLALDAGYERITVVLGAHADEIKRACHLVPSTILLNEDWNTGLSSSLRCGIRSLTAVQGALIMTCDMPSVTAQHLNRLTAAGELCASHYSGHNGIPAYIPASLFGAIASLAGDRGAHSLLCDATGIELPGGEFDIDTPEDIERLYRLHT